MYCIIEIIINLVEKIYHTSFLFPACDCYVQGSNDITCDDNGICSCKVNFINDKCDTCAAGYFDFPTCEGKCKYFLNFILLLQSSYILEWRPFTYSFILISACNCNSAGSIGATCDFYGKCSCKAGFFGNTCEGKCK